MLPPIYHYLNGRRIVLGSQSPRRIKLLQDLGLPITVRPSCVEEVYPDSLPVEQVPLYLSRLKANSLRGTLAPDEVLITADTVVFLDGALIGKPDDLAHARSILHRLSGNTHRVITGYTIMEASGREVSGEALSEIRFASLTDDEIEYYIHHCEVLDKAGSYGVQDWIGLVGVEEIRGSYNNIMGLPTVLIYRDLKTFLTK